MILQKEIMARVLFFSAHESDKETPVVNVVLKPAPRLRVKEFEVNLLMFLLRVERPEIF